ncbi:MAG: sodium:proton antiporter [Pseudomonadota bacterium]
MPSIPFLACFPFVILLLAIAIAPLAWPRFWHKNRNKGWVVVLLSLPAALWLVVNLPLELGRTAEEYVSFIVLLGSLFVISGGISLTGDIEATPKVNTIFLLIGAILANFVGTTGASMLLIRPLLRTNSERKHTGHIPVFFIFLVSNIGGCLTPLADPPLFLGYLRGVPFFWTLTLWPEWLVSVGLVLSVFYAWDTIAHRKESARAVARDRREIAPLRLSGRLNFVFLLGVLLSVALAAPAPYREIIMIAMTVLSLRFTKSSVRKHNRFSWGPIVEVAVLFAGIFVTMVPLLKILEIRGADLGVTKPWQFFWLTGGLSSFLDNAPTYLTFFSLGKGVTAAAGSVPAIAGVGVELLRAISCGAVFMGAMTYIGNGPNFMVKAIAEEQGVPVPHFFGYMAYSTLILIPIFGLVSLWFF